MSLNIRATTIQYWSRFRKLGIGNLILDCDKTNIVIKWITCAITISCDNQTVLWVHSQELTRSDRVMIFHSAPNTWGTPLPRQKDMAGIREANCRPNVWQPIFHPYINMGTSIGRSSVDHYLRSVEVPRGKTRGKLSDQIRTSGGV